MELNDFIFKFLETTTYVFLDVATESSMEDTMEILLGGITFTDLSLNVTMRGVRNYALRSCIAYGNTIIRRAGTVALASSALLGGNALLVASKGDPKKVAYKVGNHLVSAFVWWRSIYAYQQYLFGRLWPTRALEWVGRKAIPGPVVRLGQEVFGLGSSPAIREEHASLLSETAANYGMHVAKQGPMAAVLHMNLIPYASDFILDQSWWFYMYYKERVTWRRVAKAHAVSTAIMVSEIAIGMVARYAGAKVGHKLFPRADGAGAYWCENIVHWGVGFFAARYVNRLARRVHVRMDEALPATEADAEADAMEAEEMHREEEEMRERMDNGFEEGEDNFYEVLQVKHHATEDDIRKQYRKMALMLHPDKLAHLPEEEREEKAATFKQVSHAYSVLSNPEKRKLYDTASRTPKAPDFIAKFAQRGQKERIAMLAGLGTALVYVAGATAYAQLHTVVRMIGSPGNTAIRTFVMMAPISPQFN